MSKLGAKKVAVLYNDDPYGIDLGKLVADDLKSLGAEVLLTQQVKVEQNRFTDEVAKIKQAGVDTIYYAGYEVECPYLRADLRDAGLDKLTFMASDGCFLAATIDNSDGAAEGMYVTGFAPSPKTSVDQAWVSGVPGGGVSQPGHLLGQRLQRDAGAGGGREEGRHAQRAARRAMRFAGWI